MLATNLWETMEMQFSINAPTLLPTMLSLLLDMVLTLLQRWITGWSEIPGVLIGATMAFSSSRGVLECAALVRSAMLLSAAKPRDLFLILQSFLHHLQFQLAKSVMFLPCGEPSMVESTLWPMEVSGSDMFNSKKSFSIWGKYLTNNILF